MLVVDTVVVVVVVVDDEGVVAVPVSRMFLILPQKYFSDLMFFHRCRNSPRSFSAIADADRAARSCVERASFVAGDCSLESPATATSMFRLCTMTSSTFSKSTSVQDIGGEGCSPTEDMVKYGEESKTTRRDQR